LPQPGKNEYYWGDLVGMAVHDETGEALGEVTGLLSTGAHDVLQVQDGDVERLIPFVAAYVLDVDLAARSVRTAWRNDW
jgi:16S rRNA processing protein RimM